MRLLFWVLCMLLLLALVWFGVNNAGTVVPVKVGSTVFTDVPISLLVGVSLAFGVVVMAIIAIAEGARTRFENRRLTREIRQLETEIHYLRTQPASAPRPESASVEQPERLVPIPPPVETTPASAPVYGEDEEDWTDPGGDTYSTERNV
jgi:uncharacterized membrane protein YciS (DUF1049 family)